MRLFEKKCATPDCDDTVLGPRMGGKARGQWLGYDECLKCRKAREVDAAEKGLV